MCRCIGAPATLCRHLARSVPCSISPGRLKGELQAALNSNVERLQIFSRFLTELVRPPALIVLEDLHWADEATLDFLRYVGRRIGRTHSLLIVSFRSDEVGPSHPLRLVLGDLATSGAKRLSPQPLSVAAIQELIGDREVDAAELQQRTGGNPFFVTEVVAAGRRCDAGDCARRRARTRRLAYDRPPAPFSMPLLLPVLASSRGCYKS